MLRSSSRRALDKLLGKHAVKAWIALDDALVHYQQHYSTGKEQFQHKSTLSRTTTTPSFSRLLTSFATSVPDRVRQRMRDGILQTLDDVVYYLANQSTLMVFNDERKSGETPTTPRSIPPAEHLFNTLNAFRDITIACKQEWMDDYASAKVRRKLTSRATLKHVDNIVDYATAISNKQFVTWLCNNESKDAANARRNIAGHLRCTLLQLGASDPGAHAVQGGFCCRVAGCRRSAVRNGICVGHGLKDLQDVYQHPNPHIFMTDPTHRSCVMRWFVDRGDHMSMKKLRFCYQMDLFKQCCSPAIRKKRCACIFDKYSRPSGQCMGVIDFQKSCNMKLSAVRKVECLEAKERMLMKAHEEVRIHVAHVLCSDFFHSREFLEHVDTLRGQLSTPRGGKSDRFEWSLPKDTAKTNSEIRTAKTTDMNGVYQKSPLPSPLSMERSEAWYLQERSDSDLSGTTIGSTSTVTSMSSRSSMESGNSEVEEINLNLGIDLTFLRIRKK